MPALLHRHFLARLPHQRSPTLSHTHTDTDRQTHTKHKTQNTRARSPAPLPVFFPPLPLSCAHTLTLIQAHEFDMRFAVLLQSLQKGLPVRQRYVPEWLH
jgi:hypothetical protein